MMNNLKSVSAAKLAFFKVKYKTPLFSGDTGPMVVP
jgi:hypothetical protein